MGLMSKLASAFNIFKRKENETPSYLGPSYSYNLSRPTRRGYSFNRGNIIDTVINRIAMDVSMVKFDHVRIDSDPKTETVIKDGLHDRLTLEANIDQSYIEFMQDLVYSMFDEGVVAIVPVDTDDNPEEHDHVDILSWRVGRIVQWYPRHVRVELYDDRDGRVKEITIAKDSCCIIQNPLYEVTNGHNSTLKRLSRKLSIMDTVDEGIANNSANIIIQFPYPIKNDITRTKARQRISEIEDQLTNSKYGITYLDGTEKITQLRQGVENNLLKEVDYLTKELFNQLGLTEAVFNGTAGESEMKSYMDRTINPIAKRIALEMDRKFISKTARTQGHRITYHTDMFTLVPMDQLASALDLLRRNTFISMNEGREILGLQPADDPRADELFNPNIADSNQIQNGPDSNGTVGVPVDDTTGEGVDGSENEGGSQ